jgi:poly(3-hydroxybutyrate) depolymerase
VIYDLGIPEDCLSEPCGLIVDYHPAGLTGAQTNAYTKLQELGNAAGYVVVQPNSQGGAIAAGRDRVFVEALISALDVDRSRVHVGGASRGGFQTWHFICDHADLIASAAPHASGAGNAPGESCDFDENRSPAEQVDILMFHGRKDSTVVFARGITQLELVTGSWDMTVDEVLADEPDYTWTRWTNDKGTVVEFVEFDWVAPSGNGHCYPGGAGSGGCGLETAIHYGEAALAFYVAHPKGG